ncbi:hypothetical protein KCV06_g322, partial [Aureobasidium melanogenum]
MPVSRFVFDVDEASRSLSRSSRYSCIECRGGNVLSAVFRSLSRGSVVSRCDVRDNSGKAARWGATISVSAEETSAGIIDRTRSTPLSSRFFALSSCSKCFKNLLLMLCRVRISCFPIAVQNLLLSIFFRPSSSSLSSITCLVLSPVRRSPMHIRPWSSAQIKPRAAKLPLDDCEALGSVGEAVIVTATTSYRWFSSSWIWWMEMEPSQSQRRYIGRQMAVWRALKVLSGYARRSVSGYLHSDPRYAVDGHAVAVSASGREADV